MCKFSFVTYTFIAILADLTSLHTWHHFMCKFTVCVTYFDIHVIIEEDVAQLEVSMYDSVAVQVLAALQQLHHVVASLWFSHSFATLVKLQQGLWRENTEFHALCRSEL